MIQVFEYYNSHHLKEAFDAVFGYMDQNNRRTMTTIKMRRAHKNNLIRDIAI